MTGGNTKLIQAYTETVPVHTVALFRLIRAAGTSTLSNNIYLKEKGLKPIYNKWLKVLVRSTLSLWTTEETHTEMVAYTYSQGFQNAPHL